MVVKKPTLIIVHGAWHDPSSWADVAARLESSGYKIICPPLAFDHSQNLKEPITTTHNQLRDVINSEAALGNDTILIVHSFGGIVGSSAISGVTARDRSLLPPSATGKVIGLIGVCCFLIPTGHNIQTAYPDMHASVAELLPNDPELCIVSPEPAIKHFYGDLPREQAEKWASKLHAMSLECLVQRDHNYAGWLDVPMWYLICEQDKAITAPEQARMVEQARSLGAKMETRRLDASHSPFLSRPKEVTSFIEEAAGALARSGYES